MSRGPLPTSGLVPEQPLDVVAWVTVRLHTNGMISTSGTIGDKPMVLHLLAQGADAMRGQKDEPLVIVPQRDVDVDPRMPTRDIGDMAPQDRGEP
jgi:hypothetical protein